MQNQDDWRTAKLPAALYGCANEDCAAEVSHYPRDLRWWRGCEVYPPGFYCDEGANCLDAAVNDFYSDVDGMIEDASHMVGPTLEYVLEKRR